MHLPAYQQMRTHDGRFSGGIFGVLTTLGSVLSNISATRAILVWDGRHSERRKQLCPEYKEGRKPHDDPNFDYRAEFQYSRSNLGWFLKALGIRNVRCKQREADDVIYQIRRSLRAESPDSWVSVVSDDRDMIQLVDDRCSIYRPRAQEWVRAGSMQEMTGARDREEFLFLKAMQGDKSDNIAGVPGIGEVRARRLLTALHPSIDAARKQWQPPLDMRVAVEGASLKDTWAMRVRKNWKTVLRNLELVDMAREVFMVEELAQISESMSGKRGFEDDELIRTLLRDWSMHSLLLNVVSWVRPFTRLR